jgi:hypothetical protein
MLLMFKVITTIQNYLTMLKKLKSITTLPKASSENGMSIKQPLTWDMITMSTKPIEIDKLLLKLNRKLTPLLLNSKLPMKMKLMPKLKELKLQLLNQLLLKPPKRKLEPLFFSQ